MTLRELVDRIDETREKDRQYRRRERIMLFLSGVIIVAGSAIGAIIANLIRG